MSISRYSGVFEYDGKLHETPYFYCKEAIRDYIFMFGPRWEFGSRWDFKGKLLYIVKATYRKNEYSIHE